MSRPDLETPPMRDDERYPIVVPGQDHPPEVTTSPPLDYYGREKLSAAEGGDKKDEESAQATPQKTICGLRRRTFLILLVVAAVVVIAAVVGGVVGGLKSKHNNDDNASSSPPPPATTSALASGPIKPSQRAVAVAASANLTSQDITIFYTALQTQDIVYRRISNSGRTGADEQTVTNLTIKPDWGTSLAAAALNGSDPVAMQIFYLSTTDGTTSIAQALVECPSGNEDPCVTRGNSLISNGTSADVYNSTKLGALRFDPDTARVFFQDPKGAIYTLNGGKGPGSWTTTRIRQTAHLGTGLLTYAAVKDDITLFFAGSDGLPHLLVYSDVLGPGGDTVVDGSPGSQWSSTVSMGGASTPGMSPRRLFYANPNNGTLVSFFQSNDSAPIFKPNHDPGWGFVEGGIAATAWGYQTRVYYFNNGDLSVAAQNVSTWAKTAKV